MKKKMSAIIALAVLLCACLLFAGCGTREKEEVNTPSVSWRVDTTGKYLNDSSVRQLITVQAVDTRNARVKLFEKSVENGKNVWTETLSCDGYIGKNGLGKTKEGDNMTPIGDFGITCAFGIKDDPGTAVDYVDITEYTYCCGDENAYNQLIDIRECPHDCSNGEHMIDYSPEYNYGLFIDYNKEGTPGLGSAIFLHCMGANPFTGGCIAVSEENMVTILKAAEPGVRIIIDYMP